MEIFVANAPESTCLYGVLEAASSNQDTFSDASNEGYTTSEANPFVLLG
jgi:hypothetical protein